MRRAAGHGSANGGNTYESYNALEDENERLVEGLKEKTAALKSLSIDIGTEVRTQNKLLSDMDDAFEHSGSFLQRTMGRLGKLAKGGHNCHLLYLLLFAMFVFFILYLIIKFR